MNYFFSCTCSVFLVNYGLTTPTEGPCCATHLLSCLEKACLEVMMIMIFMMLNKKKDSKISCLRALDKWEFLVIMWDNFGLLCIKTCCYPSSELPRRFS